MKKNGHEMYRRCACMDKKEAEKRLKQAAIPKGFEQCSFENFRVVTKLAYQIKSAMMQYIDEFQDTFEKEKPVNSFGAIAKFGEQKLNALPHNERATARRTANSFGLGKTHLTAAAAHALVNAGYNVRMIRDIEFLREINRLKFLDDNNRDLNYFLEQHKKCDVLIWDELGKERPTEARRSIYYDIINERYLKKLPVIFSSNEDIETLEDRIGQATTDRLIEMTGPHLYQLAGASYRRRQNHGE